MSRFVAVDTGATGLAAAEHLAHRLDEVLGELPGREEAGGYLVTGHVVREPAPRFVLVVAWEGEPEPAAVAATVAHATRAEVSLHGPAVEEHLGRRAGRLVRYRGRAAIERETTAGAVVADSVVDAVEGLAGVHVADESPVDLTGHARPVWREGRCVLLVQQAVTGLVAFEQRVQIPCCSDH